MTEAEAESIFADYFSVFPWERLPPDPVGFDMGCGSGRWAQRVAPRVGYLHCIDPSAAIEVARRMLANCSNVGFHRASVGDAPLPPGSQDFGYSLGVLHHVPDTADALKSCADLLKQGAPFLVYLYYAFDNRPIAFRIAWRCSDLLRRLICKLPGAAKHLVTDALAAIVYLPLVLVSRGLARVGMDVSGIPLSYYRNRSWYTMRTDSRDRFGTPLERRFTREQIRSMMESAGLREVRFSEREPYWCAVGIRE
ncbi:MAG TPA: class I SAM-dependent methyltransferase [Xanthomonadaceae bacterium]|nr:class I SAM-dependent methyltransferase [Xanthomonadaceae bacterium]